MKLTWNQLEVLLDEVTDRYKRGQLSIGDYVSEWDSIVAFAGWTWVEFLEEIDKRWSPRKKAASPLFQS